MTDDDLRVTALIHHARKKKRLQGNAAAQRADLSVLPLPETLKLKGGELIQYWAVATDRNTVTGPGRSGPAASQFPSRCAAPSVSRAPRHVDRVRLESQTG